MPEEQTITGLAHIGIPCADIEKTIAFYQSLGFKVIMRGSNSDSGEKVAFLRLDCLTIEVYQTTIGGTSTGAIDHIALSVCDVDKVYTRMHREGYTLIGQGIEYLPFWEKGVRFFKIQGPSNEIIEFTQIL